MSIDYINDPLYPHPFDKIRIAQKRFFATNGHAPRAVVVSPEDYKLLDKYLSYCHTHDMFENGIEQVMGMDLFVREDLNDLYVTSVRPILQARQHRRQNE